MDINTPEWMSDWVAQSPDANPIENMWSILSSKVYTKPPSCLAGLKRMIEMYCDEFDDEIIENAINSMPKRMKAIIKAKGGHTKYEFNMHN